MKPSIDHIFEEVKENQRTLESCSDHDFSIDLTKDKVIDKKYRCSRCGGVIGGVSRMWYLKGREHERKS